MRNKFIIALFILISIAIVFTACSNETQEKISVLVSGDISETGKVEIFEKVNFSFEKDESVVNMSGYKLSDILKEKELLSNENYVLLSGFDSVSAKVEYTDAELIYLVLEDGKINVKAPQHPKAVNIKDLAEITVISKTLTESGIKFLSPEKNTSYLSLGNIRLKFFGAPIENRMNGKTAYKYTPNSEGVFLNDFTNNENNIVYFKNGDIEKYNEKEELVWENGTLLVKSNKEKSDIRGIICGAENLISDVYHDAKAALDIDKKVMIILPDGYSLLQARQYSENLSVLSNVNDYKIAASVYPAISNVALACMITGGSPLETDILVRGVKKPRIPDIFDYALEKGKTASYIEGNGNLIITNHKPILNTADQDGSTDKNVFLCAQKELLKNPDIMFVHFHGIDDINHAFSPESNEAEAKIKETDGYIAELIKDFVGTVIIVPDHGAVTLSEGENKIGSHGEFFALGDMFVPYYLLEKTA